MLGIDLIEVDRMRLDDSFLSKIACQSEIEYINRYSCENGKKQRVAALFAVKEAVMKALGLGSKSGVSFLNIVLNHEENGRPYVELNGIAKDEMNVSFFGKKIEVSITHTQNYASAIAMII